jgi:hypothetical protein
MEDDIIPFYNHVKEDIINQDCAKRRNILKGFAKTGPGRTLQSELQTGTFPAMHFTVS